VGGTIGFFVSGAVLFVLGVLLPVGIGKVLTNPVVGMILLMIGAFIGHTVEEKGKVTSEDLKEAVKAGVGITFGWFAIWIGVAVVGGVAFFFLKVFSSMPSNF